MKKIWIALVFVAVVAGVFFFFRSKNPAPENPANAAAANGPAGATQPEPITATPAGAKSSENIPPAASTAAGLAPAAVGNALPPPPPMALSSLPPATVLDNARVIIKNYGSEFGENPVGTNPEITEALTGKNPKGINFLTPESGLRVNDRGELVDAWGAPFFFHQLSGQQMEIHSAGADRKMWTSDDLITR